MKRTICLAAVVAAPVCLGSEPVITQLAVEETATPPGTSLPLFRHVSSPEISPDGHVAFQASIQQTPGTTPIAEAVWHYSPVSGSLAQVAISGVGTAPGFGSGIPFYEFAGVHVGTGGNVAFGGFALAGGDTDEGVWSGPVGAPQLIAREDRFAANFPPTVRYGDAFRVQGTSSNAVLFSGRLRGDGIDTSNDGVLWVSQNGGGPVPLIRENELITPDLPEVRVRPWATFPFARMNAHNTTVLSVGLQGLGVGPEDDSAMLIGNPTDGMRVAIRRGSPAPGVGPNMNFGRLFGADVNDSGQIAVLGELNREGFTSREGIAIWTGDPDNIADLDVAIRGGQPLPGVAGAPLISNLGNPSISNSEHLAFLASSGSDIRAVISGTVGDLRTLAYSGQQAPGMEPGAVFQFENQPFDPPGMNSLGQVAFVGNVEGPGITDLNRSALWATDVAGALHLLLRGGDVLEVAPGDMRTVLSISMRTGRSGTDEANVFSDSGLIAFHVQFTDGSSGAFLTTVPTPAGVVAFVLAAGCVHLRRRTACFGE